MFIPLVHQTRTFLKICTIYSSLLVSYIASHTKYCKMNVPLCICFLILTVLLSVSAVNICIFVFDHDQGLKGLWLSNYAIPNAWNEALISSSSSIHLPYSHKIIICVIYLCNTCCYAQKAGKAAVFHIPERSITIMTIKNVHSFG